MQQQQNETITPSELQFPEIEAIIKFLLTQITPYVQTNFASKEAKTATPDNVIEVIEKLCVDQRVQEATAPANPAAPAPIELFGKIANVLSITANTLASTATTIGRAVGSPIIPTYIDPNQPFHRLQHLQYFAFKAKHLRKLIADLQSVKHDSKLFNDICDKLIEELTEFFEALRELRTTSDRQFLQLSCNDTKFSVTGMSGITGGTSLGTSVLQILDKYKLSEITPKISRQKKLLHSNSLTADEIENNQSRIRELEQEVARLRSEDAVKTREVAKANDALSQAFRSQETTRTITVEREKDAERLKQLELQLSQSLNKVTNPTEQDRIIHEIRILREKISAQDHEVARIKQEMQSQKQSEEKQRNVLKQKLEAQNLVNISLARDLAQAKADQLARESATKVKRTAQLDEEKATRQERDELVSKLQSLTYQLSTAQSKAVDPQEKERITREIDELNSKLLNKNRVLDNIIEQLQQRELEAKQLALRIQQLTNQQQDALKTHDQLTQALEEANAREIALKQSYEAMQQTHLKQLAEAKAREAAQEREKTAMRLRFEKELEERKALLAAQEKQNSEIQQTLQKERKNNKAKEEAQELRTQKMQSDHERALERARAIQAEELEKIRAVQLTQEQELTAAREHQLTQARILSELNASNLALTQQNEMVNKLDNQGFNLLHTAIKLNNVEQVEFALATANANIKTGDGRSPLCLALVHDDGLGLSLKKDIDANTIKIVDLLLKNNAIASECITKMNRNFVHFLIFKSTKLTILENPKLRSEPNIKLIKLFLLNGCDFKSGDSRCGSDIGKFIDMTYKLNDIQAKAREILVTFRRYSVSELCTTLDWQHVLLDRYQQLSARAETSETANKHMMVVRQYFERYSFIFDLFVNPNNRYLTVTKASALTKAFSSKQMEDDIQKLLAIGLDSQNWLQQQPKQQARRIDSIFIVDNPELARENQLFLQTIITNLIKCIEKAKLMHEPRPVEIAEDKFENKSCILTPLEAKVIEMNLPQALVMFRENLEKKRIYEEKQAVSLVKK